MARRVPPLRALVCALLTRAAVAFHCLSDIELGPVRNVQRKGLAVDDSTLYGCPGKLPWVWPNTLQPILALRLFRAWRGDWPIDERKGHWSRLREYVLDGDVKLLLGSQISCSEEDDDQDWEWAKEFLQHFAPEQIMGVAVGNELELLWKKTSEDARVTPGCINRLWTGGHYWEKFVKRARDLDDLGYGGVTLTAVFTGASLGGYPFLEMPGQALVSSFLRNASSTYGTRFAFTFNFYPYFDPNFQLDVGSITDCNASIDQALCWNSPRCNVPGTTIAARQKMRQLTGRSDFQLWIGETGWSSPRASTLHTAMAACDDWSSIETFRRFYSGFLSWDLSIPGERPPEHVFYFTTRDSLNFGILERFGLIESCISSECKIRSEGYTPPNLQTDGGSLNWLKWAFVSVGGLVVFFIAATCFRVKCMKRGPAYPIRQLTDEV
mmetsp:Transcript_71532/g.184464  ORF Transcript_71532/g.184464 Transcript_71532/m.184464 type:complete len:438 (-) Transcript_71532:583-1896(-)